MTKTIHAVAIFVARPGAEDAVDRLLTGLIEPCRAEPGVISYNLYRDQADPRRFVFTEEWSDQAAFEAHVNSTHVKATFEEIGERLEISDVIILTPKQI